MRNLSSFKSLSPSLSLSFIIQMQTQNLQDIRNKYGAAFKSMGFSVAYPFKERGSVGLKKLRQCANFGESVLSVAGITVDRAQDKHASGQRD